MRLERWTARIQSERSTTEPLYVSFTGQPNLFINYFLSLFSLLSEGLFKTGFYRIRQSEITKRCPKNLVPLSIYQIKKKLWVHVTGKALS